MCLQANCFGLHAFHSQLAGIVQCLRVIGHFHVAPNLTEPLSNTLVRDVVHAISHHHAYRSIACMQQSPEVLTGKIRSEGHTVSITKGFAITRTDGSTYSDELG